MGHRRELLQHTLRKFSISPRHYSVFFLNHLSPLIKPRRVWFAPERRIKIFIFTAFAAVLFSVIFCISSRYVAPCAMFFSRKSLSPATTGITATKATTAATATTATTTATTATTETTATTAAASEAQHFFIVNKNSIPILFTLSSFVRRCI